MTVGVKGKVLLRNQLEATVIHYDATVEVPALTYSYLLPQRLKHYLLQLRNVRYIILHALSTLSHTTLEKTRVLPEGLKLSDSEKILQLCSMLKEYHSVVVPNI